MEADANGNIVTEVVIVYTDIAEPTATPFADVAGQAFDANPATENGTDYQSLNIVAGNLGDDEDDWRLTRQPPEQSERSPFPSSRPCADDHRHRRRG